jgi:predicted RNA-binding protein with PUA-like domain
MKNYWLMKSEPEVFGIDDLRRDQLTRWDGVRNYQARNFMTQQMKIGDEVLFYHSNSKPSGVAGLAVVSGLAIPDPSQFDKKSEYYDSRSKPTAPLWFSIEIKFLKKFKDFVSLEELKSLKGLENMQVIKKGQRLSNIRLSVVTAGSFDSLGNSSFLSSSFQVK